MICAERQSTVVATVHITYKLVVVSRELALLIEVVVTCRSSVAVVTTCITERRNEESVVGEDRLTVLVHQTSEVRTLAIYLRWSSVPSLNDRAVLLLRLGAQKLPITTKFIVRRDYDESTAL